MSRLTLAAPPLAALVYPAIIWAGPAISPLFLAMALAVPAIGVTAAHALGPASPRARAVALAVVAAPPLYSWLGGLLDFQTTVPLHGLAVWILLWLTLTVVATTGGQTARAARPRPARLAFAHGCSAAIITVFALAHLTNHLAALAGGERHIAVMSALRTVYRAPGVELVLLAAVAFQTLSGLRLLRDHVERTRSWWHTAQVASGAYLAAFFLSHLTAALRARWLRDIDTNWQWLTADSMLTDPWSARLAPYYALSVVAVGVHAALGLRYVLRARGWSPPVSDRLAVAAAAAATAASALIMTALLRA